MHEWMKTGLGLLLLGLVADAEAGRKSREVVLPDAWQWQLEATRTVRSTAVGEGAIDLPEALAAPAPSTVQWTLTGGWGEVHADGSLTERHRFAASGDPMDQRLIGIRRFPDGELLRVERLEEAALGGLDSWDPILMTIAAAMPEELSPKRPSNRALQWTARLGSGVYLRSNCPAVWTVVPEETPLELATGIEGGAGALQHVRYEASCGMNGRADLEGGRPVPLRGSGELKGDIWWDPEARWVVRHTMSMERTVHSRWVGAHGAMELVQEQSYVVSATRRPVEVGPDALRPLATSDVVAAIDAARAGWSACAARPGPHAVSLEALRDGRLAVRAAGLPPDAPAVIPDVGGLPTRDAPQEAAVQVDLIDDLSCWNDALAQVRLPPHDHLGERFDFVLPRTGANFGSPGVIDRALPQGRPRFVVFDPSQLEEVASWLGVI